MNRCGFVHMQSQEMADNAIKNLNNSLFNGANIVVERGRMKERKPNPGGPGGNGNGGPPLGNGPNRMNGGGPNRNGGNRNDQQNRQGPGGNMPRGPNQGGQMGGNIGGGGNGGGGFRGRVARTVIEKLSLFTISFLSIINNRKATRWVATIWVVA